jgi:hypothetical protein
MHLIGQSEFQQETERFLARVGPQAGPIPYEDLVESRASRPDPELAGSPEPVKVRADVLLPLPEGPVRVRLYRNVPTTHGRCCSGCTEAASSAGAWTTSTSPAPALRDGQG